MRNRLTGPALGPLLIVLALQPTACAEVPTLVQTVEQLAAEGAAHAQDAVVLQPGDDFQQANDRHPPGTVFRVTAGVHPRQRVIDPKPGNQWIGDAGAVLDGQDALAEAFSGRAVKITLRGLELRNYRDNGIAFRSGSQVVVDQVQVRDTGSGDGESNGALRFFGIDGLTVTNCQLTRVSSGILPTECRGPIRIEWNTGVNTGRNFVQLDKCSGPGIRVRYNTMERVGTYLRPGAEDVEDWISVYKVEGRPDDPAQFSYNRASGHGVSASGSFIMLGDGGGQHQEAVGNVGVTPGQVGIGLSGGEHIEVRDNRMFSEVWAQSNIAFYSSNYAPTFPCGPHRLANNRANWHNRDRAQNTFWTNDSCTPLERSGNHFPDPGLDASIWRQWETTVGGADH